ncbi:Developmentally-regulated GTP-binding protein 1 [Tupaia chinensis]|uniref:Developmentally-regulated GTP-binding protein 1 n=1 Tax=Tupaia chinensis TaxID=246437 RepID=L9KY74_TUPCH|nr:Developmentally-regulated GTP-binding protein 1 [Tupaia chinensis]
MAAAVWDSCVNAGKKLKKSLKKKMMKMVARAVASELEEEVKNDSDNGGFAGSCELEKDCFSSDDGAIEADSEDDVEPFDKENESAAESSGGTIVGWADAMAKILNKKTPKSKPTILVKNKELEKEKEKLKGLATTSSTLAKIAEIEAEMVRTQKNKATAYHLGLLKARLAKLHRELITPKDGGGGGPGESFYVAKTGDARIGFVGFPSLGKFTLLSNLVGVYSEEAAYEFNSLTTVPGVIRYEGAKIQLLDLPSISKVPRMEEVEAIKSLQWLKVVT